MVTNMNITVSCTLYTYCVVQTNRILSVQFDGFGSSYIGSCCSSSYLYVLVLYLALRYTPYLLIRYLRKLGNDHVQLCFSFRTNLIILILQSSIRHFCATCRKDFSLPENIVLVGRVCN